MWTPNGVMCRSGIGVAPMLVGVPSAEAVRPTASHGVPASVAAAAVASSTAALAPFSASAWGAVLRRRRRPLLGSGLAAAALSGRGCRVLRCDEARATPPPPAPARPGTDEDEVTVPAEAGFCEEASAIDLENSPFRYAPYVSRLNALLPQLRIAAAASVRYVAYSSDVGESLRPVLKPWQVNLTYGIATAYVVGDVALSGCRASAKGYPNDEIARTCCHTAIFQFFASLALPAVIIHTVVHQVKHFIEKPKFSHLPPKVLRFGPSGIGLGIIPFLPLMDPPCERAVDLLFDTVWPSAYAHHHGHGD